MCLEYAGEEVDSDGYYRVVFDTSLPDPEFFGILNPSTRPWAIDSVVIAREKGDELEIVWRAALKQIVLEPNHALNLNYPSIKEMICERERRDPCGDSPKED